MPGAKMAAVAMGTAKREVPSVKMAAVAMGTARREMPVLKIATLFPLTEGSKAAVFYENKTPG